MSESTRTDLHPRVQALEAQVEKLSEIVFRLEDNVKDLRSTVDWQRERIEKLERGTSRRNVK
jgi:predicted  nucleic acid-binding Zn-ribbon protein